MRQNERAGLMIRRKLKALVCMLGFPLVLIGGAILLLGFFIMGELD